jgi:hypothetical protein
MNDGYAHGQPAIGGGEGPDDALDKAEAAVQTGQYRVGEDGSIRVDARWARGGHQKACADVQFSPTFGLRMGRSVPACLFGSDRWGGFSPFFYPHKLVGFSYFFIRANAFDCAMSIWVGPLKMP